MGFSVVAASAIIFTSVIFLSSLVYQSVNDSMEEVTDAVEDRREMDDDYASARFELTGYTYQGAAHLLILDAKNTGPSEIRLGDLNGKAEVDVILNGWSVSRSISSLSVDGDNTTLTWWPGSTLVIRLSNISIQDPGTLTILMAVPNGRTASISAARLPLPVAHGGLDRIVDEDTIIDFMSGSQPESSIVNWSWDWGDDSIVSYGKNASHAFEAPGHYVVRHSVLDTAGRNDTDSLVVIVRDTTSPVAEAGPNLTTPVNETVYFNASASYDPENGTIISYDWDFGDGSYGSGRYASHIYASAGNYTVRLTLEDLAGNRSWDELTVGVS